MWKSPAMRCPQNIKADWIWRVSMIWTGIFHLNIDLAESQLDRLLHRSRGEGNWFFQHQGIGMTLLLTTASRPNGGSKHPCRFLSNKIKAIIRCQAISNPSAMVPSAVETYLNINYREMQFNNQYVYRINGLIIPSALVFNSNTWRPVLYNNCRHAESRNAYQVNVVDFHQVRLRCKHLWWLHYRFVMD